MVFGGKCISTCWSARVFSDGAKWGNKQSEWMTLTSIWEGFSAMQKEFIHVKHISDENPLPERKTAYDVLGDVQKCFHLACSYLKLFSTVSSSICCLCGFVKDEIDPFLMCFCFQFLESNIILWHQSDWSTNCIPLIFRQDSCTCTRNSVIQRLLKVGRHL